MRLVSFFLWIVVALIGISFAGLNADNVNFNYYIGEISLPLSFLMAIAFAVGGALGLIASSQIIFQTRREANKLKKTIKAAEKLKKKKAR